MTGKGVSGLLAGSGDVLGRASGRHGRGVQRNAPLGSSVSRSFVDLGSRKKIFVGSRNVCTQINRCCTVYLKMHHPSDSALRPGGVFINCRSSGSTLNVLTRLGDFFIPPVVRFLESPLTRTLSSIGIEEVERHFSGRVEEFLGFGWEQLAT